MCIQAFRTGAEVAAQASTWIAFVCEGGWVVRTVRRTRTHPPSWMQPKAGQAAPTHPKRPTEGGRGILLLHCPTVSSPPRCPLLPSRILVWIEAITSPSPSPSSSPRRSPRRSPMRRRRRETRRARSRPRAATTPPNSRPSSSGRDAGCVWGFAPAAAAVCLKNARGVCFHSAPQAASSASAP